MNITFVKKIWTAVDTFSDGYTSISEPVAVEGPHGIDCLKVTVAVGYGDDSIGRMDVLFPVPRRNPFPSTLLQFAPRTNVLSASFVIHGEDGDVAGDWLAGSSENAQISRDAKLATAWSNLLRDIEWYVMSDLAARGLQAMAEVD